MRALTAAALALVLVASAASPAGGQAPAARVAPPAVVATDDDLGTQAGELAPVRVRHYRMAGRVRPLLFWFGRDDVGLARVTWRAGAAGAKGYDLLVGTDPARAPRGINRWGFIAERVEADGGALLALMTRSDETSYDEASSAGSTANDFRAIRGRVRDGLARWQVSRVSAQAPLTVHDLDAAVTQVRHGAAAVAPRQMALEPGTRPGFLASVAELLDRATAGGPNLRATDIGPVRYVFGQRLYDLRVKQARRLTATFAGRRVPAVHTAFEIHTLATGARTAFEITAGTEGDLAGVPLLIQWQPRWWLKVELHLV